MAKLTIDINNYILDNFDDIPEDDVPLIAEYISRNFDYTNLYNQLDDCIDNAKKDLCESILPFYLNEDDERIIATYFQHNDAS